MVDWMVANGGMVSKHFTESMTSHSGISVRGVVSAGSVQPNELILRVPRNLWITLSNFPAVGGAKLGHIPECSAISSYDRNFRMWVITALEGKAGDQSFWAPYLRTLPQFADYRSFHPQLGDMRLLSEFQELPLVSIARQRRAELEASWLCLQAWQRQPDTPPGLRGLLYEDLLLGAMRWKTRDYGVNSTTNALVPGADLMNTERSTLLNTRWGMTRPEDGFTVRANNNVGDGGELYDAYCRNCNNSRMMLLWGIYLEENTVPVEDLPADSCTQTLWQVTAASLKGMSGPAQRQLVALQVNSSVEARYHGQSKWYPGRITEVQGGEGYPGQPRYSIEYHDGDAEASIAPELVRLTPPQVLRAPRCLEATLADAKEGPLRCSLARLAWESCRSAWKLVPPPAEAN